MKLTKESLGVYLERRRENLLNIPDFKNANNEGFGIADKLMKHAALFELEQIIEHIEGMEEVSH